MKKLIINADDFGYCKERNRGIVECVEKGTVSSVSILVNGVASNDVGHLKTLNSTSVGLHFNITEGKPTCPAHAVTSLLNNENLFKGKFGLREEFQKCNVKVDEVANELISQIGIFEQLMGRLPVHVDGHHHIHILPGICQTFGNILSEKGIHWTRLPVEENIESCGWVEEKRKTFYMEVSSMAKNAKEVFSGKGIMHPQEFIGMRFMGKDMTTERICDAVNNAFKKYKNCHSSNENILCEFMVHPGYKSRYGEGGCGDKLDSFSLSEEREHEMTVLNSKEWKEFLSSQDITVLPYPL